MNFYLLSYFVTNDDCEVDHVEEWFATLAEARAREEVLYDGEEKSGVDEIRDLDIERVSLDRPLTPELLLNVLNGQGWATNRESVREDEEA